MRRRYVLRSSRRMLGLDERHRKCPGARDLMLYVAVFCALFTRRAGASGAEPDVLNALARDTFFHYVEPGFSPFLCSREASYFRHPIVLRLSNSGLRKLQSLQAVFVHIDVGVFSVPDANTGSCPLLPTKSTPDTGWYYSSRTVALNSLQPLEDTSSTNTSSAANVVQMDDLRLQWYDLPDESQTQSVLLCIWLTATKSQQARPQQKPLRTAQRVLYALKHGIDQQHHTVCSRDFHATQVEHLFGAFSVSCSVIGGHWEKESASMGAAFWTALDHEPSLGYSKVSKLGAHSYDVRNVCLHSSGVLLFAPSDDVEDDTFIEHMPLVLESTLFSTHLGYGFPVTIIRNSTYFSEFEHSSVGLEQPGLLLTVGHPMRQVGHHLFESILAAYVTMNASGARSFSKTHVVMTGGIYDRGSASIFAAAKSAAGATLLSMWSAIFKQPPVSIGSLLDSFSRSPHAPVCFRRAIIGSLHDNRVPTRRQLPHLEHAAAMVTVMRAHFGLEALRSTSARVLSPEAAAFSRAHNRKPGAPLLLFVDRAFADSRALRNADEVVEALSNFVNVARVSFQGMHLRHQMIVCEAADAFVSVHGCDAANTVFMRPGSIAVTITPYCWDNAADYDEIGAFAGVTHAEWRNPFRNMTFSEADVPDCGYDPPSSKRVLGLSGQSTQVHIPMFIAHVRAALSSVSDAAGAPNS